MEGGVEIDFDAATNALKDIADSLQAWVTDNSGVFIALAGAFLVFFLIRFVIKLVKSATKS